MPLSADDRFALLDLIARYNLVADEKDVEATIALYTEDGQIVGDMSTGPGHAGLREDLPDIFALEVTLKRHLACNVRFAEPAGDEVEAHYVLHVVEAGVAPVTVATSLVSDRFRRVAGEWKVARHHVAIDPSARWIMKAGEKVQAGVEKLRDRLS